MIRTEFYKLRNGKLELYSTTAFAYDETGNLLEYKTTNAIEPALNQYYRFNIETSKTGLPLRRQIYMDEQLTGTEIFYYEHF